MNVLPVAISLPCRRMVPHASQRGFTASTTQTAYIRVSENHLLPTRLLPVQSTTAQLHNFLRTGEGMLLLPGDQETWNAPSVAL